MTAVTCVSMNPLTPILIFLLLVPKTTDSGVTRHPREQTHPYTNTVTDAETVCYYNFSEETRLAVEEEVTCLPINVNFDITCNVLEHPDTIINRERQYVRGSVTIVESQRFSEADCLWENQQRTQPRCSLVFRNYTFHRKKKVTLKVDITYRQLKRTLHLEIYNPEEGQSSCTGTLPTTTGSSTTTPHEIPRTTQHHQQNINLAGNQNPGDKAESTEKTADWYSPGVYIIGGVVALIGFILLFVWRRKSRRTRHQNRNQNLDAGNNLELESLNRDENG